MNTYCSNLIEGHNTRPKKIESALAGRFDQDEKRRTLQIEAAADVRIQAEIDRMAAEGTSAEPASVDYISWLHREFYRDAPQEMLRIEGAGMNVAQAVMGGRDRHNPTGLAQVGEAVTIFEMVHKSVHPIA